MRRLLLLFLAFAGLLAAADLPRLRVAPDGRVLVTADGSPFFWLGDTAWELPHRLSREEIDFYLDDRAQKKFNVIQAVVLHELEGLSSPNRYGALPLHNSDPGRPNEEFFRHIDYLLAGAAQRGLYVALLPTWGSYVEDADSRVFTATNARVYGEWLGRRYASRTNLIWVLGGDRVLNGTEAVWNSLAEGILSGAGEQRNLQLMTFHPRGGGYSSSVWFHEAPWLAFNMMQTGPSRRNFPNYQIIAADYSRTPAKPCIDAEPGYERAGDPSARYTDHDVRKWAYWAVFAGAFGHTYGAFEVWQMWEPGRFARNNRVQIPWREALQLPGAGQMQHLRALIERYGARVPDQALIAADQGGEGDHIRALRGADRSYALLYVPSGKPFNVNLRLLAPGSLAVRWFDPRTGEYSPAKHVDRAASPLRAVPPRSGTDWVFVVEKTR